MTIEDIALQMTPGIGVKGAAHLTDTFGDAQHVFAASEEELTARAGLRPEPARQIVRRRAFADAEREMAYCRRHGITPVAATDEAYPPLLREIPDRPHVLYLMGNAEVLTARCLSIVGTRSATPYGQTMCNRLVEGLAERVPGLCIVSGLAFGIDTAAHRAALAAGVPTVAVLANALPEVTPAQHAGVARDILAQGGALVTELHSQSKQNGNFYLARNRIIAALSDCTVVVESARKGGALVTANIAASYGRDVFAFPGRTNDEYSEGCNTLITKNVAALITSADDMIDLMCWERINSKPVQQELFIKLDSNEQMIYDRLSANGTASVNELSLTVKIPVHKLLSILVDMEFRGIIQSLPGNRYALARPI